MSTREKLQYDSRAKDWRCGGIVYQVFVDRYAKSLRLNEKHAFYAPPRTLKDWSDLPSRGKFLPEELNVEGELEFWGGDLHSLLVHLDHIIEMGTNVLYLNPVFTAFTNHKYDTMDYYTIDPQYGDEEDLRNLIETCHEKGLKVLFDGVFNHMGRRAPLFQKAQNQPESRERAYFTFGEKYRNGYLGWRNVSNLPELNLENQEVRDFVYAKPDSVVQHYIRKFDLDGWRLDVAPDIGFSFLRELTEAVHSCRQDAITIGECWNYPEEWLKVLDGIMNLHLGNLIYELVRENMTSRIVAKCLQRVLDDSDEEALLRSHLVLDNHDVARLATVLPKSENRYLARLLQFTLPGCPVVYYGSELGMPGGTDPTNRGPMNWDLKNTSNPDYLDYQRIRDLRQQNRALAIGSTRVLDSEKLFAFIRYTNDPGESLIVVVNPTMSEVDEVLQVRDSRLVDAAPMECLLTEEQVVIHSGLIPCRIKPKQAKVFRTTDQGKTGKYSMFKRVKDY